MTCAPVAPGRNISIVMENKDKNRAENPGGESQYEFMPVHFGDEIGDFNIVKQDFVENVYPEVSHRDVTIVITGKQGKSIELNTFLPKGARLDWTYERQTEYLPEQNLVSINPIQFELERWKSLLPILHEIGHAVSAEKSPADLERLLLLREKLWPQAQDAAALSEYHKLISAEERGAWAYAVSKLKDVCRTTGIPMQDIFHNLEELKEYINQSLDSYRWVAERTVLYDDNDFSDQLKKELLAEIDKLFNRE